MPADTPTQRLTDDILAFIGDGVDQPDSEGRFNDLALAVFAYQCQRNSVYRAFCRNRGVTPGAVSSWSEVPAVPTAAFKELSFACFPIEDAVAVYHSSGTSGAGPSKHYLPSLDLYHASLASNFAAHVLPEGEAMPMLILAPPPRQVPHSSLAHMLQVVRGRWGEPDSGYYLDESGLQRDRLIAALRDAERGGAPVCLLGTAFAFVHLLDHCAEASLQFQLPPGSRIMDTGGYKGRSREVPKDELYRLYGSLLGVPGDHVVNEYGMTEMGSQFYDNVLRDASQGTVLREARQGTLGPRFKVVPSWVRTVVVDPETMEPAAPGRVGLLRHYDLSNLGSAMAIQTDDLGVATGDGFEILGRASGAEARGCSIAIDELLSSPQGAIDEPPSDAQGR